MKHSLGVKLLGIFLIVYGLVEFLGRFFPYVNVVLGVLALIAGILLLVGR